MTRRWARSNGGNGWRREQVVRRLKARRDPCAICGLPIDYDLPAGHPMAFECDEIIPRSRGGSPLDINNVQATHRICNQKKGNKPMTQFKGTAPSQGEAWGERGLPLSREW